jgi:hypothetical protein
MGRAFFFDPDEEDCLGPLTADRLHAGQEHAGKLGNAILKGRFGRRYRVARLEMKGGENPFGSDGVETVEVDLADHRGLREGGGAQEQSKRAVHIQETRAGWRRVRAGSASAKRD